MIVKIQIKNEEQTVVEEYETTPDLASTPKMLAISFAPKHTVTYSDATYENLLKECISLRRSEYPSPEEFMNAWFDGGEDLEEKRLIIKEKYPKPEFYQSFKPITVEIKEKLEDNENYLPFKVENE